ncbi:hypothetical protein Q3G72_020516 [Acer saccharum]|nr:hypothetical protein Q3G72_020516 [Acer saccharum]
MHTDEPFHYEALGVTSLQKNNAAVHAMPDVGAQIQLDTIAFNSTLHDPTAVPDATASEAAQQDLIPTVSTDVSERGSRSQMVVGPDVPQVPILAVVISNTTPMSQGASGSRDPADLSL